MLRDAFLTQEQRAIASVREVLGKADQLLESPLSSTKIADWERDLDSAVAQIRAGAFQEIKPACFVEQHLTLTAMQTRTLRAAIRAGNTIVQMKVNGRYAEQAVRAVRQAVRHHCRQAALWLENWQTSLEAEPGYTPDPEGVATCNR